jgi:hypothetical protein
LIRSAIRTVSAAPSNMIVACVWIDCWMWWSHEYDRSDHTAACRYLGLDDCWAKSRDEATGTIVPDPKAFPEGMKPVAGMCPVYIVHIGSCTDYVPSIDYVCMCTVKA